jgi:hypothetical protein
MSGRHLHLIAVAAILACASGPSNPSDAGIPRSPNIVTSDQLAAANADTGNLYDAILRLRANWLAPHGTMSGSPDAYQYAAVFLDGQQAGGIEALRAIPAYSVASIRYYDITQAGARFGIKAGIGGAIEVTSRVK